MSNIANISYIFSDVIKGKYLIEINGAHKV